jgi:hypothetical protein
VLGERVAEEAFGVVLHGGREISRDSIVLRFAIIRGATATAAADRGERVDI